MQTGAKIMRHFEQELEELKGKLFEVAHDFGSRLHGLKTQPKRPVM